MKIGRLLFSVALVVASLSCLGRTPAEMDALYREAGLEHYQIRIIDKVVTPIGKRLHDRARIESALGFKSLRIGSMFPVKSAQSPTGYAVQKWHFRELPSVDPDMATGTEETFECWSQSASIVTSCLLVQGDNLAAAFGQRMRSIAVFLTRPEAGFDPVFDSSHMGVEPVVVGVVLVGQGEELAKVALAHFTELYGKRPSVSTGENQANVGPSSDECRRVNGKKLADLTTQDLRIRKACAAPIHDLLALASSSKTAYAFNSPMGATDITVEKTGFGVAHVSIKMMHPRLLEHTSRATLAAKAAMDEYNQHQKTRKLKDF